MRGADPQSVRRFITLKAQAVLNDLTNPGTSILRRRRRLAAPGIARPAGFDPRLHNPLGLPTSQPPEIPLARRLNSITLDAAPGDASASGSEAAFVALDAEGYAQDAAAQLWVSEDGCINIGSEAMHCPTALAASAAAYDADTQPTLQLVSWLPEGADLCSLPASAAKVQLPAFPAGRAPAPLPACFLALPRLTSVTLRGWGLSGGLAPWLSAAAARSLSRLELPDNALSGGLPPLLAVALPALRVLSLRGNALSGGLAALRGSALERVSLGGNALRERDAPSVWASMPRLAAYELEQAGPGALFMARSVLPAAPRSRWVLTLTLAPALRRLCELPEEVDERAEGPGACAAAPMPLLCAAAACPAGARGLADALAGALLSPEAALPLARAADVLASSEAAGLYPLADGQWLLRWELQLAPGAGLATPDGAPPSPQALLDALLAPLAALGATGLGAAQLTSLCPRGALGPDCSLACPSQWAAFDEAAPRRAVTSPDEEEVRGEGGVGGGAGGVRAEPHLQARVAARAWRLSQRCACALS